MGTRGKNRLIGAYTAKKRNELHLPISVLCLPASVVLERFCDHVINGDFILMKDKK